MRDKGERGVEAIDVRVGEVLRDELKVCFVEPGGFHHYGKLPAGDGHDPRVDVLWKVGRLRAAVAIKGHFMLRLATGARKSDDGVQDGG
jgi:hypothetical protein